MTPMPVVTERGVSAPGATVTSRDCDGTPWFAPPGKNRLLEAQLPGRRDHQRVSLPRIIDRSLERLGIAGSAQAQGDDLGARVCSRHDRIRNGKVRSLSGRIQD